MEPSAIQHENEVGRLGRQNPKGVGVPPKKETKVASSKQTLFSGKMTKSTMND